MQAALNKHSDYWTDFWKFSKSQIEAKDSHPAYAVLKNLFELESLELEQKIWRLLIFLAFDHLGSAEWVWKKYPKPQKIKDPIPMKTSVARRLFRGNTLWADQINYILSHGTLTDWIESTANQKGEAGWKATRDKMETVKYNGAWASFKWADMVKNILDYDITADNIGENECVLYCAELLTHKTAKEIMKNIHLQRELYKTSKQKQVKFKGLDQLETALCDFVSFIEGRYYIGMEIDSQMNQIGDSKLFYKARALSFDPKFLGEENGYFGIRDELKSLYKNRGVIEWWNWLTK